MQPGNDLTHASQMIDRRSDWQDD